MKRSLIVALLVTAKSIGCCVTTDTIAKARLNLVGSAAKLFQTDNCSAPTSFRDLTYPQNYLMAVSERVYTTVWQDPYSTSAEPLIIETDLGSACIGFDIPSPIVWRIRSRGIDSASTLCNPESRTDDLVFDASNIDEGSFVDSCTKSRELLENDSVTSSPEFDYELRKFKELHSKPARPL